MDETLRHMMQPYLMEQHLMQQYLELRDKPNSMRNPQSTKVRNPQFQMKRLVDLGNAFLIRDEYYIVLLFSEPDDILWHRSCDTLNFDHVLDPATGKFIDIKWVKVYLSGIRKEIDLRALRQKCQCVKKDL